MAVSISIIDYIGKVKEGVAILLSLNIDDTIFQIVFWFNRGHSYVLNTEDSLLKLLKVDRIYDYEHLEDLLIKIFQTLPPVEEIFKRFDI